MFLVFDGLGSQEAKPTLQVNDLILLELVIQKHYSSKQTTWFYWAFGLVGLGSTVTLTVPASPQPSRSPRGLSPRSTAEPSQVDITVVRHSVRAIGQAVGAERGGWGGWGRRARVGVLAGGGWQGVTRT